MALHRRRERSPTSFIGLDRMDLAALHLELAPWLPVIGGTLGGALLLYLLVTTLTACSIPGVLLPISLTSGLLLGPWVAVATVATGAMTGSLMMFALTRRFGAERLRRRFGNRLEPYRGAAEPVRPLRGRWFASSRYARPPDHGRRGADLDGSRAVRARHPCRSVAGRRLLLRLVPACCSAERKVPAKISPRPWPSRARLESVAQLLKPAQGRFSHGRQGDRFLHPQTP